MTSSISKTKKFISKYIKSFGPSRYSKKPGDTEFFNENIQKFLIKPEELLECKKYNSKVSKDANQKIKA